MNLPSIPPKQLRLCLLRRVVFVDWHGVLSRDLFWSSILGSDHHPLRTQLEGGLGKVFSGASTADAWMKGLVSSRQVVSNMGISLDGRFREDYLVRRLNDDCVRMRVNVELLEFLRSLRSTAAVVLATDNMDCFATAFEQARRRRRRSSLDTRTLAGWADFCDDIICSSDVGRLKAEDPPGFFGGWLAENGLWFDDALLIDDKVDNCEAFRGAGGHSVQWRMGADTVEELTKAIGPWITP